MNRLGMCTNTLRALAQQSADPSWYLLAERCITEYLRRPGASLQGLASAIDREAETSQTILAFWTTIQELVGDTLPPNETNNRIKLTANMEATKLQE